MPRPRIPKESPVFDEIGRWTRTWIMYFESLFDLSVEEAVRLSATKPGEPGLSTSVFPYRVDLTSTGSSDPGKGKVRFSNVTQSLSPFLYFDWLTTDGFDVTGLMALMDAPDILILQDTDLALNHQVWELTGPVVMNPDWFAVPVSFVSSSGAGVFTHNQPISVLVPSGGGGGGGGGGGVTAVTGTSPIASSGGTTPAISISAFTGDSGSGGAKGAVPAPAAGDAAALKVLGAGGGWVAGGPGTVTSVALTVPAEFSVAGSPITTSGTLAVSKATQSANAVFAGPTTGSAAAPTFRAVVPADLPLASSSAFGAVKVDGTTITAASGVISAAGGASGALVLLEQHTASSSATLDFTSWYSSSYDEYLIELVNLLPATNNVAPWIRLSTNGGSTYDSGAHYSWGGARTFSNATSAAAGANADAQFNMMGYAGSPFMSNSQPGLSGSIRLYSPGSGSIYKVLLGQWFLWDATNVAYIFSSCLYTVTTAVNALRFLFSSGNITSGTIRIYGIAK